MVTVRRGSIRGRSRVQSMIGHLVKEFGRIQTDLLSRAIFGISCRSFLPHEVKIIYAVADLLSLDAQTKLRAQLSSRFFIDRSNPHMNVISIGQFPETLGISGKGFRDCLFTVNNRVNGRVSKANVTFYRKFLFSVETRLPRRQLLGQEVDIISVIRGTPRETLSSAIDRSEHGAVELG